MLKRKIFDKNKLIAKIKERQKKKSLLKEFLEFLKEYKIIGLAIAFIMGAASTALIKSLVNDVVMPVITAFIPNGEWETATLKIGSIVISWGSFLSEIINFIIIAFAVFFIAKILLKKEKDSKN